MQVTKLIYDKKKKTNKNKKQNNSAAFSTARLKKMVQVEMRCFN